MDLPGYGYSAPCGCEAELYDHQHNIQNPQENPDPGRYACGEGKQDNRQTQENGQEQRQYTSDDSQEFDGEASKSTCLLFRL